MNWRIVCKPLRLKRLISARKPKRLKSYTAWIMVKPIPSALSVSMPGRLVERGLRFVQPYHCGGGDGWHTHGDNDRKHLRNGKQIDKPIAVLITDFKARGLLDSTLVIWGGEFGRTPTSEGSDGRDYNPYGYSVWMAGDGIRGGAV